MMLFYQAASLIIALALGLLAWSIRGATGLIFTAMSVMTAILPLIGGIGFNLIQYDEFALLRHTPDVDIAEMVALALFGTFVGYLSAVGINHRAAYSHSAPSVTEAKATPRLLHRFLAIAALLFLLIALLLAQLQPGGVIGVVMANLNRVPLDSGLSSVLYAVSIIYGYFVMALLVSSVISNRRLPLLHLLFSAVLFWTMGGRIQFASIVISYVLLLVRYKRLNLLGVAAIFIPAAFAMNLILVFRLLLQGSQSASENAGLAKLLDQLSMLGTYDLALQYVKGHGYNPLLYPSMIFQIVPRALYPEKPIQISREFRHIFFNDDLGGIPPGLWGEFWISGDLVGAIVLGGVFGMFIAWLDLKVRAAPRQAVHWQALIFLFIPVFSIFAVRGGIDNSIFRIFIVMGSAVLLAPIVRVCTKLRVASTQVRIKS